MSAAAANRLRIFAAALFLFPCVCAIAQPALSDDAALAALLREAARETASHTASAPTILLRVVPENAPPALLQVFAEELSAHGAAVSLRGGTAAMRVTVDAREMRASAVSKANSSYLRHLSVRMGVVAEFSADGAPAWSKEFTLARTDTLSGPVTASSRDFLDAGAADWTETILAPIIAAAAAAIVVILLFTVRSS